RARSSSSVRRVRSGRGGFEWQWRVEMAPETARFPPRPEGRKLVPPQRASLATLLLKEGVTNRRLFFRSGFGAFHDHAPEAESGAQHDGVTNGVDDGWRRE